MNRNPVTPRENPVVEALPELRNFSLVLGGPLYQLIRKAHLDDDDVHSHLRWRIFVICGIIWLPLLILCAFKGTLLDLIPMHPDRNCGLGFLTGSSYAFSPLLASISSMVAGLVAGRIFHQGASLTDFKLEIVLLGVFGIFFVLGPLTVFAPMILSAKRRGLREYGIFAADYTRDFDRRWLRRADHDGESMLGTGDIQSLADLGNAFSVIREIKAVPFTRDTFVQLACAILLPFSPLVLTMIPLEELLDRIVGAVF